MEKGSNNRRDFLKKMACGASAFMLPSMLSASEGHVDLEKLGAMESGSRASEKLDNKRFETPGIFKGMPIKATFLDEVSWDIPHQNWGIKEWDADFRAMKRMGIDTVVMIRSGLGKWIASPFDSLLATEDVYYPPVDLVELFLTLADKYDMKYFSVCMIPGNIG